MTHASNGQTLSALERLRLAERRAVQALAAAAALADAVGTGALEAAEQRLAAALAAAEGRVHGAMRRAESRVAAAAAFFSSAAAGVEHGVAAAAAIVPDAPAISPAERAAIAAGHPGDGGGRFPACPVAGVAPPEYDPFAAHGGHPRPAVAAAVAAARATPEPAEPGTEEAIAAGAADAAPAKAGEDRANGRVPGKRPRGQRGR